MCRSLAIITMRSERKMNAADPAAMAAIQATVDQELEQPEWSNDEYHADRTAVSCSVLKTVLRSPAHMKAYLAADNNDTTARLIGTALHSSVLEPALFAEDFVEWRDGDRRGKKYTEFAEAHAGKSILKSDEMTRVLAMRDSILGYKEFPIGKLLKEGQNEKSIIWTDEETGVTCKIRPDNINPYSLFDLKTTDDSRPAAFSRNCVRMMYDMQAAMYQEGVFHTTGLLRDFYFIAVEDDAPHATWVHQASAEMLAAGKEKFRAALLAYKHCQETGEYPTYEKPFSVIEWPRYA